MLAFPPLQRTVILGEGFRFVATSAGRDDQGFALDDVSYVALERRKVTQVIFHGSCQIQPHTNREQVTKISGPMSKRGEFEGSVSLVLSRLVWGKRQNAPSYVVPTAQELFVLDALSGAPFRLRLAGWGLCWHRQQSPSERMARPHPIEAPSVPDVLQQLLHFRLLVGGER